MNAYIGGRRTMNAYIDIGGREISEPEKIQDKLYRIKEWIDAYPLAVFPEPDFVKAAKVLEQNGMSLDSISASNMRYVLSGIKKIIEG